MWLDSNQKNKNKLNKRKKKIQNEAHNFVYIERATLRIDPQPFFILFIFIYKYIDIYIKREKTNETLM